MYRKKKNFFIVKALCFIGLFLNLCCTDPVAPVYEYKDGLVYVDSYISTARGGSYAIITEVTTLSGKSVDLFVKGATVSFRNIDTNHEVFLTELKGSYSSPNDFHASVGETWELLIKLPDERTYKSKPETIIEPVGFSNLKATYNRELLFSEAADGFFPGHFISLDLDDPGADENYYFWKFRSFEKIETCDQCLEAILRDGRCVDNGILISGNIIYGCDTDCWQIRYNKDIRIFSDDFTNGILVQGLPVGDVVLYTKNNIVVEVQQYSLSPSAYKYYKILKDIVDNNGGFNAPPPAALIGNIFSPEDGSEFVLGRFTAASATVKSIFIDRSQIKDKPVEFIFGRFEKCADICTSSCDPGPPSPECIPITSIACEESRFRTSIQPEGWVD